MRGDPSRHGEFAVVEDHLRNAFADHLNSLQIVRSDAELLTQPQSAVTQLEWYRAAASRDLTGLEEAEKLILEVV